MFHLHRAQQLGTLVPALAEVLQHHDDDPMSVRVVSVSARGMERWLSQRLSHELGASVGEDSAGDDGVCANVDMPSPADLVARLVAEVVPAGAPEGGLDPAQDPWRPDRLIFSILTVLQDESDEEWAALVATHLGLTDPDPEPASRNRRFGFARRIAHNLVRYASQRPALLRNWRAGVDDDGHGGALPLHQQWQPHLFRSLCRVLPGPDPVQRTDETVTRLRSGDGAPGTGELCLFGPSRLDDRDLAILLAAAEHREVHLFLAHPSPGMWAGLAADAAPAVSSRAGDTWARQVRNPLLRSLAQDSREFQVRLRQLLAEHGQAYLDRHHEPPPPAARTTLTRLQEALAADRAEPAPVPGPPGGTGPVQLRAPAAVGQGSQPTGVSVDRSVELHSCVGAARQVEVLRDLVTGLLCDDPTLEPRDILVMCPQVETFAPLILATFAGLDEPGGHPGRRLRIRLADRSLRQVNPVLGALAAVLDLADARLTSEQVLDLLALEPVRHRFHFDEDDLTTLREWVVATGIKWGLTVRDRERVGVGPVPANTWHLGLDRLLLGVAMDTDGHLGRLDGFPLDGIDSTDVERVGRFTEFVHRLAAALRPLQQAHPAGQWATHLDRILTSLTSATGRNAWQLGQARSLVLGALPEAGEPGAGVALTVTEVVDLLDRLLAGQPTRASFRTGDLTICSLVPLRSVPHRVVVLLGMDHDAYPRNTQPDGDDVLRVDPRVGEFDIGGQERQILLDALCAARDQLHVIYSGAEVRAARPLPPARPVAELAEAVTQLTGDPAVLHRHPLNPFDPRPFLNDGETGRGPLSFDPDALSGARARLGLLSESVVGRLRVALPDAGGDTIDLDDLARFAGAPVEEFVRHRLGYRTFDPELDDGRIPLHLNALGEWAIGDSLLRLRQRGGTPGQAFAAEQRRGGLPPGTAGQRTLAEVGERVDRVLALSADLSAQPADRVDIAIPLPDGRRLTGTVRTRGDVIVDVRFSGFGKPAVAMACWVPLLALVAATGQAHWSAVAVTGGRRPARRTFTVDDPDWALARLQDLVGCQDAGLREPLPLPARTTFRLATSIAARDEDPHGQARQNWDGPPDEPGERAQAPYADLWPGLTYQELIARQPLSAATAAALPVTWPHGWCAQLVDVMWLPALRHCRVSA